MADHDRPPHTTRRAPHARFAMVAARPGAATQPPTLYVFMCACGRYVTAHCMPSACECGADPNTFALIPVMPQVWPYTAWRVRSAEPREPDDERSAAP